MTNDNSGSEAEPSYEQLAARVDELETEVEDLTSDEAVEDEQGRTWSLGALLNLGLTRREAMFVLGAVGSGATFAAALRNAVGVASANPDEVDVGTPSDPADAYLSNVYGPHGSVEFQDPLKYGGATMDRHETLIGHKNPTGDTTQVQFSNLPSYQQYRLWYSIYLSNVTTGGDVVHLRVDGDADGNGDYYYWDETGTKNGTVDSFHIVETDSDYSRIVGNVRLSNDMSFVGFDNGIQPARASRVANWGQAGGTGSTKSLNSIEIFSGGSNNLNQADDTEFKLFGVVQ